MFTGEVEGRGLDPKDLQKMLQEARRHEDYLASMQNAWPEDEPPLVGVQDIGGSIGLICLTQEGNPVLDSRQLSKLRVYEKAKGITGLTAEPVGGYFVLNGKNGHKK